MQNSVIIHGITPEELTSMIRSEFRAALGQGVVRDQLSVKDIAKATGYSRPHIRKVIRDKGIPFTYDGKEIMVSAEFITKFKTKQ